MSRELLTDDILRQAVCTAAEKRYRDAMEDARLHPHTFRPEFHKKMRRLLKGHALSARHPGAGRIARSSSPDNSFLLQLRARRPKVGSFRLRRRYLAIAALLMVFASVAALASETVRNGLAQLRLQFFPDNVTIEAAPEPATEQAANGQTGPTATKEFHAYKWKEVPEGYEVVYEYQNEVLNSYQVDFKNNTSNYIYYVQNDIQYWQSTISFDSQKGYKRIIKLDDNLEAYSISDGRNNTIFYKKNGYLFEFMSDQPEEMILDYIDLSGVLEYEY